MEVEMKGLSGLSLAILFATALLTASVASAADTVEGGEKKGITFEDIMGKGGWLELLYKLRNNSLVVGWTVDDPDNDELPSSGIIAANGTTSDGRTKNEAYYVSERFKAGGGVEIGIDYLYWQADYKTLKKGTDNMVNLVFQYNF